MVGNIDALELAKKGFTWDEAYEFFGLGDVLYKLREKADPNELLEELLDGQRLIDTEDEARLFLSVAEPLKEIYSEEANNENEEQPDFLKRGLSFIKKRVPIGKLAAAFLAGIMVTGAYTVLTGGDLTSSIHLDTHYGNDYHSKEISLKLNADSIMHLVDNASINISGPNSFFYEKQIEAQNGTINVDLPINATTWHPGDYNLNVDIFSKTTKRHLHKTFELYDLDPVLNLSDLNIKNHTAFLNGSVYDPDTPISFMNINLLSRSLVNDSISMISIKRDINSNSYKFNLNKTLNPGYWNVEYEINDSGRTIIVNDFNLEKLVNGTPTIEEVKTFALPGKLRFNINASDLVGAPLVYQDFTIKDLDTGSILLQKNETLMPLLEKVSSSFSTPISNETNNISTRFEFKDITNQSVVYTSELHNISQAPATQLLLKHSNNLPEDGCVQSLDELKGTIKMPKFVLNATQKLGIKNAKVGIAIPTIMLTANQHVPPTHEILVPPPGAPISNLTAANVTMIEDSAFYFDYSKNISLPLVISDEGYFDFSNYTRDIPIDATEYILYNVTNWNNKTTSKLANITIPNWAPFIVGFNATQNNRTGVTSLEYTPVDLENEFIFLKLFSINKDNGQKELLENTTIDSTYPQFTKRFVLPGGNYSFLFELEDSSGHSRICTPHNTILSKNPADVVNNPKIKNISAYSTDMNTLNLDINSTSVYGREIVNETLKLSSANGTVFYTGWNESNSPRLFLNTTYVIPEISSDMKSINAHVILRDILGREVYKNKTFNLSSPEVTQLIINASKEYNEDYLTDLKDLVGTPKDPLLSMSTKDNIGIREFGLTSWRGGHGKGKGLWFGNAATPIMPKLTDYGPITNDDIWGGLNLTTLLLPGNATIEAKATNWLGLEHTIKKNITVPDWAPFVNWFNASYDNTTDLVTLDGTFIDLESGLGNISIYAINSNTGEKIWLTNMSTSPTSLFSIPQANRTHNLPIGDYSFGIYLEDLKGHNRTVIPPDKISVTQPELAFDLLRHDNSMINKDYELYLNAKGYYNLDKLEMSVYQGTELQRDFSYNGNPNDYKIDTNILNINANHFTIKNKTKQMNGDLLNCFYPFYGDLEIRMKLIDIHGNSVNATKNISVPDLPPIVEKLYLNQTGNRYEFHNRLFDYESDMSEYGEGIYHKDGTPVIVGWWDKGLTYGDWETLIADNLASGDYYLKLWATSKGDTDAYIYPFTVP